MTWYELNAGCAIEGLPACISAGMWACLPMELRNCYSIRIGD